MPDNRARRPGVANAGLGTQSTQSRSAGGVWPAKDGHADTLLHFKNHGLTLYGVRKSVFQLR